MNGDLAQVLALLHTSGRRWQTLRAEGEEWQDDDRTPEVFARLRRPGSVMSIRGAPGPAERDPRWRLWVRRPDRARVEHGGAHGARFLEITNGSRRFASRPQGRNVIEDRSGARLGLRPAEVLVETAVLTAALELDVTGRGRVLGREVFTLQGRATNGDGPGRLEGLHPFVRVADGLRLEVDAERGVILRLEAILDGAPVHRVEMTDVAFDEDLAEQLFVIPPAEVPTSPRPPRSRRVGPPEDVLGVAPPIAPVLATSSSTVVAVDRILAYPDGFELYITVRTREPPQAERERAGRTTWPADGPGFGPSLRFGLEFADGRAAYLIHLREPSSAQGVTFLPLSGTGTAGRFDQRFWVEPLPPPGLLGLVVDWPPQGIPETRVNVSADAILDAASRAVRLWTGSV